MRGINAECAPTDPGIKNIANSNIGCKLLMTMEGRSMFYMKVSFGESNREIANTAFYYLL